MLRLRLSNDNDDDDDDDDVSNLGSCVAEAASSTVCPLPAAVNPTSPADAVVMQPIVALDSCRTMDDI